MPLNNLNSKMHTFRLSVTGSKAPYCLPLLLLVLSWGCREGQPSQIKGTPPPPNIIYILADDLGYGDLGCYGQSRFETPNIDQLSRDGMLFTQHYAGAPVCAPSRCSLLTGLHTGHAFIRGNKEIQPEGQYPLQAGTPTLAKMLKAAGYVTAAFGKWGLGFPGSEGDPTQQGFDEFFGYNCQRLAHNYYPHHLWHNNKKLRLVNNAGHQQEIYAPQIIQQKALDFLEQNKDTTFFLYYPTPVPHAELLAPERYMKAFRGKFPPETPYQGVDAGDNYKNGGYGSQAEPRAAFAAMVAMLDEQVGELRQKLAALGIADNTLIIFTSDNGPHKEGGADPGFFDSNGPLRGYKRDLYEGGIRVPMIALWPDRILPGSRSNHVSAFWDLFPTLAEVAGGNAPAAIDGISFLPELLGGKQKQHEYLYWEFHEQGGRQAVRLGKWKGVRQQADIFPDGLVELYDLDNDPGETRDLALKNPKIASEIITIMANEHEASSEFPFKWESSATDTIQ
jgi:arylsulfatase A-like enzyme